MSVTFNLVTTRNPDNLTPYLYLHSPGATTMSPVTLPSDAIGLDRRPTRVEYRLRNYLVGQWTKNITLTEFNTAFTMGIQAPSSAATLASGGAGVVTANVIGYLTFRHKIAGKLIHESSLGPASNGVQFRLPP